jgi:hypothetical protein
MSRHFVARLVLFGLRLAIAGASVLTLAGSVRMFGFRLRLI